MKQGCLDIPVFIIEQIPQKGAAALRNNSTGYNRKNFYYILYTFYLVQQSLLFYKISYSAFWLALSLSSAETGAPGFFCEVSAEAALDACVLGDIVPAWRELINVTTLSI